MSLILNSPTSQSTEINTFSLSHPVCGLYYSVLSLLTVFLMSSSSHPCFSCRSPSQFKELERWCICFASKRPRLVPWHLSKLGVSLQKFLSSRNGKGLGVWLSVRAHALPCVRFWVQVLAPCPQILKEMGKMA